MRRHPLRFSPASTSLQGGILMPRQFGASDPSFGHTPPHRSALRVARKFCHPLALGGVSHEFFRRNHRPASLQDWAEWLTASAEEGSAEIAI